MELDDLAHAQSAVSTLLADLDAAAWARPTPCAGWDVAAVTRHLVAGEQFFTASLTDARADLAGITGGVDALDAEDLPTSYAVGASDLCLALAAADPAGTYPTGLGPLPRAAVARLRMIEALTHGWDIAQGAGARLEVDDDVAERAIRHSLVLLERLPADRAVFGAPQPAPEDSPALDRLVSLLGRPLAGTGGARRGRRPATGFGQVIDVDLVMPEPRPMAPRVGTGRHR